MKVMDMDRNGRMFKSKTYASKEPLRPFKDGTYAERKEPDSVTIQQEQDERMFKDGTYASKKATPDSVTIQQEQDERMFKDGTYAEKKPRDPEQDRYWKLRDVLGMNGKGNISKSNRTYFEEGAPPIRNTATASYARKA